MAERIELTVPAEIGALPDALAAIAGFAAAHRLDPRISHAMELVADEIISNVIRHGRTPSGRAPRIRCAAEANATAASIVFLDDAAKFDPLTDAPAPDLDASVEERRIGGLGAFIVQQLTDDCVYRRDGDWNRLEVSWRLGDD